MPERRVAFPLLLFLFAHSRALFDGNVGSRIACFMVGNVVNWERSIGVEHASMSITI